ncbi:MAG: hypothetical protein OYG31_01535 [Candidatus Kaiserbacteria bacterium]|nr:hypothetical protein [Candidatus Kaiserbacteria bacterium]
MASCSLRREGDVLDVQVDDGVSTEVQVRDTDVCVTKMIADGVLSGNSVIKVRGSFPTAVALTLAYRINPIFDTVAVSYPNPKSDRYVVSYARGRKYDVGDLLFNGGTHNLRLRQRIFQACMHFTKQALDSRDDTIFNAMRGLVGVSDDDFPHDGDETLEEYRERLMNPVVKIDRPDTPALAAMLWADHLVRPSKLFDAVPSVVPSIVPSAVAVFDNALNQHVVTCVNKSKSHLHCVGDCVD